MVCISWLAGGNASSGLMLSPAEDGFNMAIQREGFVPPGIPEGIWHALCEDSGASVVLCTREGGVVYASRAAWRWLRYQMRKRGETNPNAEPPAQLQDSFPANTYVERLALICRVCDNRESITYESVFHEIRYRVTIRPIQIADSAGNEATHALLTTRHIKPWERAETHHGPDVTATEVEEHDPGVLATLSTREVEVLILIGEGYNYAQIAERLCRSVRTVERHRDRLGQKLNASDRVQLARFAIRAGLSGLPTPSEQAELEDNGWDPIDLSTPIRTIANRRVRPEN